MPVWCRHGEIFAIVRSGLAPDFNRNQHPPKNRITPRINWKLIDEYQHYKRVGNCILLDFNLRSLESKYQPIIQKIAPKK